MAKPDQCKHCQKPATIHLTQIVDQKIHKVDLCEECPFKAGVTDPEGFSLADFLLKPPALLLTGARDSLRCEHCGFTPANFKKLGRFGCPVCYESFKGMLKPMLANMHKDTVHRGRVPERALARVQLRQRVEELEARLASAVEAEDYEQAARLRDELAQMRGTESLGR